MFQTAPSIATEVSFNRFIPAKLFISKAFLLFKVISRGRAAKAANGTTYFSKLRIGG